MVRSDQDARWPITYAVKCMTPKQVAVSTRGGVWLRTMGRAFPRRGDDRGRDECGHDRRRDPRPLPRTQTSYLAGRSDMARCQFGSTSDESLIFSAESAFLNDVRGWPFPDDVLLRSGYKVCSLLSRGQDREDIAAGVSRGNGLSMGDSRYFVTRVMVRLCPVM
jgi:hypothetical protein